MSTQAEFYEGADGQTRRMWRAKWELEKDATRTSTYLGYESACGHCWLGHSHSIAAHEEERATPIFD